MDLPTQEMKCNLVEKVVDMALLGGIQIILLRYGHPLNIMGGRYHPLDIIGIRYQPQDIMGGRYHPQDIIGCRYHHQAIRSGGYPHISYN